MYKTMPVLELVHQLLEAHVKAIILEQRKGDVTTRVGKNSGFLYGLIWSVKIRIPCRIISNLLPQFSIFVTSISPHLLAFSIRRSAGVPSNSTPRVPPSNIRLVFNKYSNYFLGSNIRLLNSNSSDNRHQLPPKEDGKA